MLRLFAVALSLFACCGVVTHTAAAATAPSKPPALNLRFERSVVAAQLRNYCRGTSCVVVDPQPCYPTTTAPCGPVLGVHAFGALFIRTGWAANSVRVLFGSGARRSYRASARDWAIAVPAYLTENPAAIITVRYRNGVVAHWTASLVPDAPNQ